MYHNQSKFVFQFPTASVTRTCIESADEDNLLNILEEYTRRYPVGLGGTMMIPATFQFKDLLCLKEQGKRNDDSGDATGFISQLKHHSTSGRIGFQMGQQTYVYLYEIMLILGATRAMRLLQSHWFGTLAIPLCILLNDVDSMRQPFPVSCDKTSLSLAYALRRKEMFQMIGQSLSIDLPCLSPGVPSLRVSCEIHFAKRLTATLDNEPAFSSLLKAILSLPDALIEKVMSAVAKAAQPIAYQTLWKLYQRLGPRRHRVVDVRVLIRSQHEHDFCLGEAHRALVPSVLPFKSLLFSAFDSGLFVFPPKDACGVQRLEKIFPSHFENRPEGKASICDRETFLKNFSRFSHDQLRFIDWNNVAVLGGSVTACLLSDEEREKQKDTFASSDIDLCLYGENDYSLLRSQKLKQIYEAIVKAAPDAPVFGRLMILVVISTGEAVTFVRGAPYRHIQVLGAFADLDDVVRGIDIDCNAFCFDGTTVFAAPRALISLNYRMNVADPNLHHIRGCPTYELRLLKYVERGFSIGDLTLRRKKYQQLLSDDIAPSLEFDFSWRGERSGASCVPGVGQKLLLQAEKHPQILKALLRMGVSSIPCGPKWTREMLLQHFCSGNVLDSEAVPIGTPFDAYTPSYEYPYVVESKDIAKTLETVSLLGNETRFLVPCWNVGEEGRAEEELRWNAEEIED